MVFSEFYKNLTPDEKKAFADDAESSVNYLNQVANGHKTPGIKGAKKIEEASGGIVSRAEIRPDYFDFQKSA